MGLPGSATACVDMICMQALDIGSAPPRFSLMRVCVVLQAIDIVSVGSGLPRCHELDTKTHRRKLCQAH